MSYIKFTKTSTNSRIVFERYINNEISKEEYAKTKIYFNTEEIAVYSEELESINHRTWLKAILNPIVRIFGWTIVSLFENQKFQNYAIRKYPIGCKVILQSSEVTQDVHGNYSQ